MSPFVPSGLQAAIRSAAAGLPQLAASAPEDTAKARANKIKHRLRSEGYTVRAWADAHGYKYRDVSDVIRGIRRGYFGVGRDIARALGLDPDTGDLAP